MTIEPSVAFGEPTLILLGGVVEPNEAHIIAALYMARSFLETHV